MDQLPYWNHNAAYYPWLRKKLSGCRSILDVGCGDGTLVRYLSQEGRTVIGIDPSSGCIAKAEEGGAAPGTRFYCCSLSEYPELREAFDAVVFVASLHHMDMIPALKKAAGMLTDGGLLLVVGLASPSSLADHTADLCRIVPARMGSRLHRMKSPEDLGIPVCGRLPEMREVRETVRRLLPGAELRRGLYWRYLLSWNK